MRNGQGGGRASAREAIGRVAAATIARKVLEQGIQGIEVVAYVRQIHTIEAEIDSHTVRQAEVESSIVRCPQPETSGKIIELIQTMRKGGDSLGGVIECVVRVAAPGFG